MQVEYELRPEDWGAFAERCAARSPSVQRTVLIVQAFGSFAMFVVVFRFTGVLSSQAAIIATLLAGAWWWGTPRLMYRRVRREALTRERPCMRGRHLLDADSDGLHAKCDVTESLHRWSGVRSIESKGTHVFVFIGDSLGYVVPRARIVSGDLEEFVQVATSYAGRDA